MSSVPQRQSTTIRSTEKRGVSAQLLGLLILAACFGFLLADVTRGQR